MASGQTASGSLEYLAEPAAQRSLVTDPTTGATLAAAGSVTTQEALEVSGWPESLTRLWLQAIDATFSNPVQLQPLRIAETRRYLLALEQRIVAYLDGEVSSAADVLEAAAEDWRAINDAIGVETQRDLFHRSRMAPPAQ